MLFGYFYIFPYTTGVETNFINTPALGTGGGEDILNLNLFNISLVLLFCYLFLFRNSPGAPFGYIPKISCGGYTLDIGEGGLIKEQETEDIEKKRGLRILKTPNHGQCLGGGILRMTDLVMELLEMMVNREFDFREHLGIRNFTRNHFYETDPELVQYVETQAQALIDRAHQAGPVNQGANPVAPQAPQAANPVAPQAPQAANPVAPQAPQAANPVAPQAPQAANPVAPQVPQAANPVAPQAPQAANPGTAPVPPPTAPAANAVAGPVAPTAAQAAPPAAGPVASSST